MLAKKIGEEDDSSPLSALQVTVMLPAEILVIVTVVSVDLSDELQDFAQRKELVISSEREYTDTVVYSEELPNFIFEEYKKLYPLYKFLLRGSLNE